MFPSLHLKDLDIPVIQNILDYILVDELKPSDMFGIIRHKNGSFERVSFLLSQRSECSTEYWDCLTKNLKYIEPWRTIYINVEYRPFVFRAVDDDEIYEYGRGTSSYDIYFPVFNASKNRWHISIGPNHFNPFTLFQYWRPKDVLKYLKSVQIFKNSSHFHFSLDCVIVSDTVEEYIASENWNNISFDHITFDEESKNCPIIESKSSGLIIRKGECWVDLSRMQNNIKSLWICGLYCIDRDCCSMFYDVDLEIIAKYRHMFRLKNLNTINVIGLMPQSTFLRVLTIFKEATVLNLTHFIISRYDCNETDALMVEFRKRILKRRIKSIHCRSRCIEDELYAVDQAGNSDKENIELANQRFAEFLKPIAKKVKIY